MPILFNEDDHFDFDKPENNFIAAVAARASWGYLRFPDEGRRLRRRLPVPPRELGSRSERKRGFFRLLAEITGSK